MCTLSAYVVHGSSVWMPTDCYLFGHLFGHPFCGRLTEYPQVHSDVYSNSSIACNVFTALYRVLPPAHRCRIALRRASHQYRRPEWHQCGAPFLAIRQSCKMLQRERSPKKTMNDRTVLFCRKVFGPASVCTAQKVTTKKKSAFNCP